MNSPDPRRRPDRRGAPGPVRAVRGLALALGFCLCPLTPAAAETSAVDFARDIEPVLVKRCSECHGPDVQKAGLRLDQRAAAFKGGKSGLPAIVPSDSAASELIARITSSDPDDRMPPKGEPLQPDVIDRLRRWIDAGAVWPDTPAHWAFLKPNRPPVPVVRNPRWPVNDIDRFILARLEAEGLAPSPESDRNTLIRRVTFDLTGLPPTPAEVDAFVADRSPQAYERLVERLLDSPHYGEHLARHWLDLARYADSNGYQVDSTRSIWPYREWVIRAINRNQPFDQFTLEQLAGDLLPYATLEQKIATGFNRNTKTNDEGGGDEEEYRTKAVKDRVATVGTTWLGLTVMCAECHSHKYDPITQEDYYRLYAIFNNTTDRGNSPVEPTLAVPPPPVQARIDGLRVRMSQVRAELAGAEARLADQQSEWEQRAATHTPLWAPLALTNAISVGGSSFTNLPDGSLLAGGVNPIYDTITVEATAPLDRIAAVLLEVLPDPSLPKNGPGRWRQTGNFILDEFAVSLLPDAPGGEPEPMWFQSATADWEQRYYRAEHAVDRNPKTGWAIAPEFGKPHLLIATLKTPLTGGAGKRLAFRFEHYHGNSHTIGRFRISVTRETDPAMLWPVPQGVAAILTLPPDGRTAEQQHALRQHHRASDADIRRLEQELLVLNEREADLVSARFSTLVMQERTEPRETFIHVRGNFLEKGPAVGPGLPEFLPPLPPNAPSNRLGLAQWLVHPDHPLTARVTVNRFWERLFGIGLVKTSEDFGRQGERPSHPELLDWLATEFIRSGWDVKAMQKLLVLSATYRQSAAVPDALLRRDPYNRFLARGPRFRLDAEMIRDQALAVSGLLNPEIGGPSVFPVQIANLWKEIGFLRPEIGMDEWPVSTGSDLYRRGLYTFWRRVCTYPTFATFDAPSRDVCVSRRPRTNTPLQALAGLNELTLVEAARVLAQRIMLEGGTDPARQIEFAFRLCTARFPVRAEHQRLLRYFEQQRRAFAADPAAAAQLVSVGEAPRPGGLDTRLLAAWTMVANVLLNLDETLTKG